MYIAIAITGHLQDIATSFFSQLASQIAVGINACQVAIKLQLCTFLCIWIQCIIQAAILNTYRTDINCTCPIYHISIRQSKCIAIQLATHAQRQYFLHQKKSHALAIACIHSLQLYTSVYSYMQLAIYMQLATYSYMYLQQQLQLHYLIWVIQLAGYVILYSNKPHAASYIKRKLKLASQLHS